jgi:beta-N-acetylhexosaminidase
MAAVRAGVGSGRGAVLALKAGADLLCVGNPSNLGPKAGSTSDEDDYLEVRNALLAALDDGTLTPDHFEAAASRIRRFTDWSRQAPDAGTAAGGSGRDWVDAAGRAFTGGDGSAVPAGPVHVVDARTRGNIAAGPLSDVFSAALARRVEVERTRITHASEVEARVRQSGLAAHSGVIVVTDNLSPGSGQPAVAQAVRALLPQAVLVHTGTVPAREPGLPFLYTHGSSRATAEALALRLLG